VENVVQNLLEAPIASAEPLLKTFGADEINGGSRAFCAASRATLAKYPFNPDATTQASLQEVTALIHPTKGSLWKFYNEALAGILPKEGNTYVPKADAKVKLAPGFVNLIRGARTFADILFKDDRPDPHLSFTVQPMPADPFPSVTIYLDGEKVRSTSSGSLVSVNIEWPGTQGYGALSAGNSGQELQLLTFSGPWAVFQLFNKADSWSPSSNGYRVGWAYEVAGQRATTAGGAAARIVVQLTDAGGASTVLRKGLFSGVDCPAAIAR
jgi:type VI secretion system protein ImpL